jgi:ADP-ribose pyrophosphatase YjhB (NUDIX family)
MGTPPEPELASLRQPEQLITDRPLRVSMILTRPEDGMCLIMHRNKATQSYFCLPGERVEDNDTTYSSVVYRGLMEEFKVPAEHIASITAVHYWFNPTMKYREALFRVELTKGAIVDLAMTGSEEKTFEGPGNTWLPQWTTLDQAASRILPQEFRPFLVA